MQPQVDKLKSLVDRVQPSKIPVQSYGTSNSLKTAGRSVKSKGKTMILADKIIENRKKNGWSQEELARMLGVSRQSVSKWEGIQAVPDMNKILQMADLFGVTTDYLLRDDIDSSTSDDTIPVDSRLDEVARKVSMEDANAFLEHNEKASTLVSTGVMMTILSSVLLIFLMGARELGIIKLSEGTAIAIGVIVLLLIVAVSVAIFITIGMEGKAFEYLEKENIDTEYGVAGMIGVQKADYAHTHTRLMMIGVVLCIISPIPLVFLAQNNSSDGFALMGVCILMITIAIGVKLLVMTGIKQSGYKKLLEEGDYTRQNKRISRYDGVYWSIVVAIYLTWSFITMRWEFTWIVWPIAGVLYGAYREIMKLKSKDS